MSELFRDLRFALRSVVQRPGVSFVIIFTLAVAIGANAAVFSLIDALVLRPFPIPDVERLVMIWETVPTRGVERGSVAPANFIDWREETESLEELVAYRWWDANLTGEEQPERLQGTLVTPGFLSLLGVEPIHGRTLFVDDNEPLTERTAVISHQLWSRRFAADPGVVGKTLLLNGERYEIVGVAPDGFTYPWGAELWAPLVFDEKDRVDRDRHYLQTVGRAVADVTVDEVQAELDVLANRLEREHPRSNTGRGVHAVALADAVIDIGAPAFLGTWQATVVFVLLIACVNVANLLLARGADRQRELALRVALGAGRFRLVGQLLSENLLLAFVGALLSLPLAWVAIDLLRSSMPAHIAKFVVGWDQIDLDLRVVTFAAGVTVLTTLLFGLVPALSATRPELTSALKEGGRGSSEGSERRAGRNAMVVAEVAVTLMLLVASGLSIRGTLRMMESDQGYDPDGLLTLEVKLDEKDYGEESRRQQFFRDVLSGVSDLATVSSADFVNILPSNGSNDSGSVEIEGQPSQVKSELPVVDFRVISPGYGETMRIPLLRGRPLSAQDRKGALAVAIVSEKMARLNWPDSDALGKRFRFANVEEDTWLTVVGVYGDVTHDWFFREPRQTVYLPVEQQPMAGMILVVRTDGEPAAVISDVRARFKKVDPRIPLFNVKTMRRVLSDRMIGLRYAAVMMGIFGGIALLLSAVGIYGVMAYSVSRRTHEIGVRVALGAGRNEVLQLIMGRTFRLTLLGIGMGLLLAFGAGKLMASNLFGVVALDVSTFVIFTAILATVAMVAGFIPARRALAVNPVVALRDE